MSKSVETKIGEIGEWLGTGSLNFFGRQFAGKDERAKQLGAFINAPVLGGGDILRGSVIPDDIREIMDRGDLIPSDAYKKIVLPYLGQAAFRGRPLMLSAVGRMKGEEEGVLAATEAAGHPIKTVPYIVITEDEAFRRLRESGGRGGRADDTEAGLRRRLDEFTDKTTGVLEAYESLGLLLPIDGMHEEQVVFGSMIHLLHERAHES